MVYIATYDNLIDSITRAMKTSASADFPDEAPRLLDFAERKLARRLKVLMSTRVADDTMVVSNNLYAKPARWLETVSVSIRTGSGFTNFKTLDQRSYEYLLAVSPDQSVEDEPDTFSDFENDQIIVAPTPDLAYPFRFVYYERPEPLSPINQLNWLSENAPNALYYGALVEACIFLRDDERLKSIADMYEQEVSIITGEQMRRTRPRTQNVEGE